MRYLRLLALILAFTSGAVHAETVEDAFAAFDRQDDASGLRIFQKLAEGGNAEAQFRLGMIYGGNSSIAARDDEQSLYWYRKAADQGHAWAQSNLGTTFKNGDGVPQDYQKALYWYRKAADQGWPIAQTNLGRMYEKGLGLPKNDRQAVYWYRKAGDWGEHHLGAMKYRGVPIGDEQAVTQQPKPSNQGNAADKTNAAAQNNAEGTSTNAQAEPKNEEPQAVGHQPTVADPSHDNASSQSGSFSAWHWLVLIMGAIAIHFASVHLLKKRLGRGANEASPNILFWRSLNFPAVVFYLLALYLLAKEVHFSLYGLWIRLTDVVLLSTFLGTAIGVSIPGAVFHYLRYRSLRSAISPTQSKPEVAPHVYRQPTDDALWEAAMSEYDGPERQKGLYARLFAQEDGDESRVKAQYLKARVDQLRGGR